MLATKLPILYPNLVVLAICTACSGIWAQQFTLLNSFDNASKLNNTNGIAVADYDLDGDLDIFLVGALKYEAGNDQTWSRLLRNNGGNHFTDVTTAANLLDTNEVVFDGTMGDRMAASWGDYDNDGYPDLFLANNGMDMLWKNEGDGTFSNVTESADVGGCLECYSANGLWWDYDLDGDLDLYVSDWHLANRQYRNEGNGIFTDVSIASGLDDDSQTWASIPIDVNLDQLPDLYVVNDYGENFLFINDGAGKFYENTAAFGLRDDGNGMGIDVCDYNNDGHFDIYVTNIFEYRPNPFFVGNEEGAFLDKAYEAGIDDTGWGWGARFFDADHDTDEDLYVVNGMFLTVGLGDENMFFENSNGRFYNIANSLGVNSDALARGLEVFDADLDGDLEMVVANRADPVGFYENELDKTNSADANWLQIKLQGVISNKDALGSIVSINCKGEQFYRHHSGANLFGQSLKPIHFGLGEHTQVDEIEVTWPNGQREYFQQIPANRIVQIIEGTGSLESLAQWEKEPIDVPNLRPFPNPFQTQISIQISDDYEGWVHFQLADPLGKQLYYKNVWVEETTQVSFDLPAQSIQPGLYYYKLSTKWIEKAGSLIKH